MDQDGTVLIGYATGAGSTRGVAERIAARLAQRAVKGDCRELGPDVDPTAYDAWVIGSAVHSMAWLPAATDFLARAAVLPARPCWCFSVGGIAPAGHLRHWMGEQELRRVEQRFPAGLRVRDHALFAGVVVHEGMPLAGRLFWRAVGGRPGDQRDWPAIDRWAGTIADGLGATTGAAGPAVPGAADRS